MSDREAVHYAIADGVATIARGKASVLAAMDLGYESGVLEAEHLHVEVYAARMLWRGHERFSEKRQPVRQGR